MIRFLKFFATGVVGFLVDASVLAVLTHSTGMGPVISRFISFFIAVVATWVINRNWSFSDKRSTRVHREFAAYLSSQSIGMAVNFLVYVPIVRFTPKPLGEPIVALAVASACAIAVNYVGLKHFVFRPAGENTMRGEISALLSRYAHGSCTLAVCLTTGGVVSVMMGKDGNFDLRNYHLYNGWAMFHDRSQVDFFAAGIQGFFNPLLDIPYYLMSSSGLNNAPAAVAFIMGLPYGILIFLTAGLIRHALALFGLTGWRLVIGTGCALVTGVSGAACVCQIGAVFNEVQVACFVVASVWVSFGIARRNRVTMAMLLFSGALAGLAAGLKLTACVYAPALALALMLSAGSLKESVWRAIGFSIGWWVFFSATYGWWALKVWQATGSPMFPMFNKVFHSPLLGDASFTDDRFKPVGLIRTLFYPFFWIKDNNLVAEPLFRDPRFFILECAVFVLVGMWFFRFRLLRTTEGDVTTRQNELNRDRSLRFLLVFVSVAYVLWMGLFSILRYAIPLEVCCGLMAILALYCICWRLPCEWRDGILLALIPATFALRPLTRYPDFGRPSHGDRLISVKVPELPPGVLLLGMGPQASYLVPFFYEKNQDIRMLGVSSELIRCRELKYPLWNKAVEFVKNHHGPVCVIIRPEYGPMEDILHEFGLKLHPNLRRGIDSNIDPTLWLAYASSNSNTPIEMDRCEMAVRKSFSNEQPPILSYEKNSWFVSGWSDPEQGFRWSLGNNSLIRCELFADPEKIQFITLKGHAFDRQRMKMELNGRKLYEGPVRSEGALKVSIPPGVLIPFYEGANVFHFEWPDARAPSLQDSRQIAFSFQSLSFQPFVPDYTFCNAALFLSGWSAHERGFRWSEGGASMMSFLLEKQTKSNDFIVIAGRPLDTLQHAKVYLNEVAIFDGIIPAEGLGRIAVPPGTFKYLHEGENNLRFIWSDARIPGNGDPRILAYRIEKLSFGSSKDTKVSSNR